MIKLHQATAYNVAAVPQLRQLLDDQLFPPGSNPATDDQRLYEMSLAREPRERDDVRPFLSHFYPPSWFIDSNPPCSGKDCEATVRVGLRAALPTLAVGIRSTNALSPPQL